MVGVLGGLCEGTILPLLYWYSKSGSLMNAYLAVKVFFMWTMSLYSSGSLPCLRASNFYWTSSLATSWFLLRAFSFFCSCSAWDSLLDSSAVDGTGLESQSGLVTRVFYDLVEARAVRWRACCYQGVKDSLPRKLLMLLKRF